jgi:hypothetical protein
MSGTENRTFGINNRTSPSTRLLRDLQVIEEGMSFRSDEESRTNETSRSSRIHFYRPCCEAHSVALQNLLLEEKIELVSCSGSQ